MDFDPHKISSLQKTDKRATKRPREKKESGMARVNHDGLKKKMCPTLSFFLSAGKHFSLQGKKLFEQVNMVFVQRSEKKQIESNQNCQQKCRDGDGKKNITHH